MFMSLIGRKLHSKGALLNQIKFIQTVMAELTSDSATVCKDFKEIKEGKATILIENSNNVFYNNVQEFNRDITIVAITEYAKEFLAKKKIEAVEFQRGDKNVVSIEDGCDAMKKVYPGEHCEDGITILEALSASGLRSVRMAKEVPGIKQIVANDISKSAVEAIERNINHNNANKIITVNEGDASLYMYEHKGKANQFDVIDIDPYGTATPFLDAAVQAVRPQGLLCVTCTDMAVLCGNNPDSCYAKYRSIPLKTKCCHEKALRILLGCIEQQANRYSRYIEPLLSVSVDFYIRVFVKVHYGPAKAKMSTSKQSYMIRCGSCSSYYLQPVSQIVKSGKGGEKHIPGVGPPVGKKCEHCGCKHSIGGPIWAAPLYNKTFLDKVLRSVKAFPNRLTTSNRIKGMVTMMSEELHDVPLYYVTDELSSVLKMSCPPEAEFKSALINAGYRVSSFHGRVSSIKTDAPPNIIWDIMRALWEKQNLNPAKHKEGSAAYALLHRTPTMETIDFTITDGAQAESKKKGITRFPVMPDNWGPKARARDNSDDEESSSDLSKRSKKFQGKRKGKEELDTNKKAKIEEA